MVSSDHIGPGEEGKIRVTVDTKGRKGKITKTVQIKTNDPSNPLVILTLYANVIDLYHSIIYPPEEIFRAPCRSCHVERGIGRFGAQLFWADCIMCHQRGKSAPSIEKLKKLPEERIWQAIEEGIPDTTMPGFSAKNGGPLTTKQIRSLVKYIKNR